MKNNNTFKKQFQRRSHTVLGTGLGGALTQFAVLLLYLPIIVSVRRQRSDLFGLWVKLPLKGRGSFVKCLAQGV